MEKEKASVTELKELYLEFKNKYPGLPNASTKQAMVDALHDFENKNPDMCELIQSEDQFYGISKGANRLAKHVQWVFISASKDYTEESEETKTSALGQLLLRTVRSKVNFAESIQKLKANTQQAYQKILDSEQTTLIDISKSLGERLAAWSNPGISAKVLWRQDSEKTIKVEEPLAYVKLSERGFDGELARFGHGLQRSYMLALLQELSTISDQSSPTLLMAIEEPEIYQHPPQARHLAEVLHELAQQQTQVLVCSHSPLFIPGDNFEAVRIVREKDSTPQTYVSQLTYSDLSESLVNAGQVALKEQGMLAKLYPSLNPIINEMFFCKRLILTEGIEDIAYIMTSIMLLGQISEFRRCGCHIVPTGGKSSIIKPLAMAKLLDIPVYVVCDADTDNDLIPDEIKRNSIVGMHKKDNRAILNLCGYAVDSEWPSENIQYKNITMWSTNLTLALKNELGDPWQKCMNDSFAFYGQPGDLHKNPLAIARSLEAAWSAGLKSGLLKQLVESIISFSKC